MTYQFYTSIINCNGGRIVGRFYYDASVQVWTAETKNIGSIKHKTGKYC